MTKLPRVFLIVVCLFLGSCKSDFNINAPHQDVYALNCILRNDTSIQYATISKNYFTENGAPPPSSTVVPNVKGATIQIFNNDSVFVMRDTTVELTESGTVVRVDCYYLRNLTVNPGGMISIEAALPDGQVLKSSIRVPVTKFAPSNFPLISYTKSEAGAYVRYPSYIWLFRSGDFGPEMKNILSRPQLEIDFVINEGGSYVSSSTLVPLANVLYTDMNGILLSPVAGFSLDYTACTSLETVNKTMQEISGGDPYKNNYIITRVFFNITSMDPELTKYYFANEVWLNSATIKLRPTDYSNVEGGRGIFGLWYKSSNVLGVDPAYISSFGYQYDPSMH